MKICTNEHPRDFDEPFAFAFANESPDRSKRFKNSSPDLCFSRFTTSFHR